MSNLKDYEIEFSYKIPEGNAIVLQASNSKDAEFAGLQYVRETYSDVEDVKIVSVKELTKVVN